nr:MAG TPA: hypothetical protein [Caudoviricetes sp.]
MCVYMLHTNRVLSSKKVVKTMGGNFAIKGVEYLTDSFQIVDERRKTIMIFATDPHLKEVVLIYKLLGNPEDLLYDEENPIEILEV